VPFERNPRFTGRESRLTKLEEINFMGDQTTKAAITGLGGLGKAHPAILLASRGARQNLHQQNHLVEQFTNTWHEGAFIRRDNTTQKSSSQFEESTVLEETRLTLNDEMQIDSKGGLQITL
jgi:hypothetical protein